MGSKGLYFTFTEDLVHCVNLFLTAEERAVFLKIITNYGLYGIEPAKLTNEQAQVWPTAKKIIDEAN